MAVMAARAARAARAAKALPRACIASHRPTRPVEATRGKRETRDNQRRHARSDDADCGGKRSCKPVGLQGHLGRQGGGVAAPTVLGFKELYQSLGMLPRMSPTTLEISAAWLETNGDPGPKAAVWLAFYISRRLCFSGVLLYGHVEAGKRERERGRVCSLTIDRQSPCRRPGCSCQPSPAVP